MNAKLLCTAIAGITVVTAIAMVLALTPANATGIGFSTIACLFC